MEILFAGICLWDTQDISPGVLGIMPNGSAGATIDGHQIPPHITTVFAPAGTVDTSQWNAAPQPISIGGAPFHAFRVSAEDISFDPPPNGGNPSISRIPRAQCAAGKRVRTAFVGDTPPASQVGVRIPLPAGAALSTIQNRHGSFVTKLDVPGNTRLIATSFGQGQRSLSFTGASTVVVANVDLDLIVASAGHDDDHAHLYCPMFEVAAAPADEFELTNARDERQIDAVVIDGLVFERSAFEPAAAEIVSDEDTTARSDGEPARRGGSKRRKPTRKAPLTAEIVAGGMSLGPGCSNSQWP